MLGRQHLVLRSPLALALLAALSLAGCGKDSHLYEGPPIELPQLPEYHYPVRTAVGTEYIIDQEGRPYFLHGDAAWSLISATRREDMEFYLDDRAARGVNSILVVLIDHIDPLTNAYGEPPFSVEGDFSTPNEAYFEYADEVLAAAQARGIEVWLFPIYLGYKGGDEGFYQDMMASDPETMRGWGRYVGERYKDHDALLWVMGGDYLPPAEGLAMLNEVAAGIAEKDSRHVFTAHWAGEVSGHEVDVSWLELNEIYTYEPVYLKATEAWASGHRPFVLMESIYENRYDSTTQQIRAQSYDALLGGAKGHFYGNNPVWFFGGDWKRELNSKGAAGMMHLLAFFMDIEWTTLVPDLEREVVSSGQGEWGTRDFAPFARDEAGTLGVLYVPSARDLVLDLGWMQGPCRARWFDPTAGGYRDAVESPLPNAASVELSTPGENRDGDGDWILLLQYEG